jgi:Flp pilus assembly protein TadD
LAAIGQHARARAEMELARTYDPHSMIISVWKGIVLRLASDYENAIQACLQATQRDPEYVLAHWALGLAYEAAGYLELASAEFETAEVLSGGSPPGMLSALAYNRAIQGDDQRATELLEHLHALSAKRYVAAYDLATVYVGLRDDEGALKYLDKASQERSPWIVALSVEPRMQRLICNVYFQSLLRRLRLPLIDAPCAPKTESVNGDRPPASSASQHAPLK